MMSVGSGLPPHVFIGIGQQDPVIMSSDLLQTLSFIVELITGLASFESRIAIGIGLDLPLMIGDHGDKGELTQLGKGGGLLYGHCR